MRSPTLAGILVLLVAPWATPAAAQAQTPALELTDADIRGILEQGGTGSLTYLVRNLGDLQDTARISIEGTTLASSTGAPRNLSLFYTGAIVVEGRAESRPGARIEAAPDLPLGNYSLTIRLRWDSRPSEPPSVVTHTIRVVAPQFGLSFHVEDDVVHYALEKGGNVAIRVKSASPERQVFRVAYELLGQPEAPDLRGVTGNESIGPGEERTWIAMLRSEERLQPNNTGRYELRLRFDVEPERAQQLFRSVTVPIEIHEESLMPPISASISPADGPANGTAIARVLVASAATAALDLTVETPPGIATSPARFTIEPGTRVPIDVTISIPPDAPVGGTTRHEATLRWTNGSLPIEIRVGVSTPIPVPKEEPVRDPVWDPPPVPTTAIVPGGDSPSTATVGLLAPGADLPAAEIAIAAGAVAAVGGLVAIGMTRSESFRYVLLAAGAPLYTRLAKARLLDAASREELWRIIASRPGITLGELKQARGMSNGALVHHTRMLERHGFITSLRDGKFRRFYVAGNSPGVPPMTPTSAQDRLLALLADGPLTRPQLAERLGVSQQGVSYHVKNLERAGRVVVRRLDSVAHVHLVREFAVERRP